MRPIKGLNKDADKRSQPEGTYRNALNASLDEELGVLRREKGLEQASQFSGYTIQGNIILDNGNVVLFLYDGDGSPQSKIEVWDPKTDSTSKTIADSDFNSGSLSFADPVQAIYRKLDTGDTVIYWTDGVNPPRFLNLDQAIPSKVQDLDIFGKIDSGVDFSIDQIRDFGGSLEGGTYQIAFAYVDEDRSVTNYFYFSNPIPITSRQGFGVSSDDKTSKSIRFTLDGIDQDYPFVRIAVIKGTNVQILSDFSPSGSSLTYTFTGNEESTDGTLEDIIVDNATYQTAGVIQDHEGTLYMADLTRRQKQDFQRHANDIKLEAVTKPLSDVIDDGGIDAFRDPAASQFSTYKRGEVYAFYISYILKNGSETEAFHIPGFGSTVAGGGSTDPYESDIIVNTDFPSPSAGAAQGSIEGNAPVDTTAKASHNAVDVISGAGVNVNFDVLYIDDTGTVLSTVNIGMSAPTAEEIVDEIITQLNADSSFSGDFTASKTSAPNKTILTITADAVGSTWNGYDVTIANMSTTIVDYQNNSGSTSGGQDQETPPDRDVIVEWDTDSVTETVTITAGMSKGDTIDAYVSALQGNTTFTDNYSIVDNGTSATITADSNGAEYNGKIRIVQADGTETQEKEMTGGWTSGDSISFEIRTDPGSPWVEITGIAPGETKANVASAIHSELDANGPSDFDYTLNSNEVNVKDQGDRDLEGKSPDYRSSFDLPISASVYQIGGSTVGLAEGSIKFTGPAPNPPASPATGLLDNITSIPSNPGTKADGDVVRILSSTDANVSYDVVLYDDSNNVVTSVSDSIASGDSPEQIAASIVGALENQPGAPADFTASVDGDTVHLDADNIGTQYNGYYVNLTNFSEFGTFLFDTPNETSGGEDSGGTYGDHTIITEYDDGNQTISVTVTLDHSDTASQVSSKYTTALNNDTNWSSNYTATDNGGSVDIESDTDSATYNGNVVVEDPQGNSTNYANINGGTDGSEDLGVGIRPSRYHNRTDFTVSPGSTAEEIASQAYSALSGNSDYEDKLIFTLNVDTLEITEQTGRSDINEEVPSISSDFSISYSVTEFSGGGSTGSGGGSTVDDLLRPLSSGHPLKPYEGDTEGTLKKFHADAPIVNNGFSYWEQAGETYPDEDRWDVVDENGTETGELRGKPIRHHRFPDVEENPHVESDGSDVRIVGVKAKDVHVPSSIEDDVIGYKIYYARKSPGNRLILDQSTGIHGWLDNGARTRYAQQNDDVFTGTIWSTHGFPPDTDFNGDSVYHNWDISRNLIQFHPFETLRKQLGIQGVTHVKIVGTVGRSEQDEPWDSISFKNSIYKVNAASYLDHNQRDVSLGSFGFSNNYDNLFGESKIILELDENISRDIPVCDICQLRTNVHRPYDNQELVSTGYMGDIDEDASDSNAPDPPVIYGGDIYIDSWYYKANTLLALAEKDAWTGSDTDNDWLGRDDGPQEISDILLRTLKETIFGDSINKDERDGYVQAIREIVGNTAGIESLPIAWGSLWFDLSETRDRPPYRTEGEEKIETFYPASEEYVTNPKLSDIPTEFSDISDDTEQARAETRWVFQFFVQSDNWLRYNEEYSRLNIADASFPYRKSESKPTEFPSRIIRSAVVGEQGERSAWRAFLEEDHVDLPQDRGKIINIAPFQSNILIHTTESLFRTRASQKIKTTTDSAFVGSGDLFRPKPTEIISIDEGYGGLLDHRSAQVFERGYVFVDKEAGKVFLFSGEINEISSRGMRTFFRDNIKDTSVPRVGYDPHTQRIFVSDSDQGWTYSFHPGIKAWVSEHSFQADYYFTTREHLFSVIGDTIYRLSTGNPGEYEGVYHPFKIKYVQHTPQPESQIIVGLIIDSTVLDAGTEISEDTFGQFKISNSYQDTGLVNIRPKIKENGNISNNVNARLTDQAWKINRIRDASVHSNMNPNIAWKHKRRMSDNVHEVELIYDTDDRVIELFSSVLINRNSRR